MTERRARLRQITEADLPDYVRWFNDPEVTQHMGMEPGEHTLEGLREWLAEANATDSRSRFWAIEAGGRHVGRCGLMTDYDRQAAGLTIVIGEPSDRGKGYGAEAIRQMLNVGFGEMGLARISLGVFSGNAAGIRCYERCGFRHEGCHRRAHLKRGRWVDIVRMSVLREEWQARQRGLAPDQLLQRGTHALQWQRILDTLRPQPGETIVDAGCRSGMGSVMVTAYVLPHGRVLGFDINPREIERAAAFAERDLASTVSAQAGDIRSLPLPDNYADAWFCRMVLEYLRDPMPALQEAMRVVKPGGRVVALEVDWDTATYNLADKDLKRRFVAAHTDDGHGSSVNGRVGSQLLAVFRRAGMEDIQLQAYAEWNDTYPSGGYLCHPLGDGAVARGSVGREDMDAFYAALQTQAEKGEYLDCHTYFICSGRVR